jgi:hypothetical protein
VQAIRLLSCPGWANLSGVAVGLAREAGMRNGWRIDTKLCGPPHVSGWQLLIDQKSRSAASQALCQRSSSGLLWTTRISLHPRVDHGKDEIALAH